MTFSYSSSSTDTNSLTPITSVSSTAPSSSTNSIEITTSSQPSCVGSVTYYGTTPPTVYETVTVPFTVTVTAANVSLTTPAIYTPPPPCFQSVMSPAATAKCMRNCPLNNPTAGETATGSAYTSTVLVTKKTPVPTVVPNTSPPPDFSTPPSSIPYRSVTPAPGVQPESVIPTIQSSVPLPAGSSAAPAPANSPAPAAPKGGRTTTPNIGSLGNSGISGPALSTPAPKPTTATVNGVPVIVLPSSSGVVVGGQVVSIPPSGSQTKIVANGNTFTLGKSAIIGPSITIALAVEQPGASPTPVTANGLTFKVGATQAIISGKTYAIGAGAPTTTLTIGGQTVLVGPSGVGVPGVTIAPEKATTGPLMSVVTAGGVTITYGSTEAIVGSSTYRIGQGASQTVITVNGKTISLGAGGVGLASSTIPPAKITRAPSLSAVTVDGVSFSVDATEVVIGSSTFRIGSGAPTETTVVNGKTVSIGPSGVGLGSTTVRPPTATAGLQTGGAASAISERLACTSIFGLAALVGLFLI
jgi:hypothetical protein